MKYKLVALDLDCTLLDSRYRISRNTCEYIRELHKKGVGFIIATGRMNCSASQFLRDLDLQLPIISYNGAMLRERGETLFYKGLDCDVVDLCFSEIGQERFMVFVNDRLYVRSSGPKVMNYISRAGVAYNYYACRDTLEGPAIKLILVPEDFDADVEKLRAAVGKRAYVTYSTRNFIEVMHPSVSKGEALAFYCSKNGIGPEQVIAFGDGENDLPMLSLAGLGIAMDNAPQIVKDQAQTIAPSNDEEGVYQFLRRIFE